jgi:hypothetical protein
MALSQSFVPRPANAQGTWGTPYGWLGPQGSRVWEEYRKFANPGSFPPVSATDPGDGSVTYDSSRQYSMPGLNDLSIAPGVFLGTAHSQHSPTQATVMLSPISTSYDFRIGFAEDLGSGGGASLSTFVRNQGGDNGATMDLFFGNWGVDGLFVKVGLSSQGATWVLLGPSVQLKAAGSQLSQTHLIDNQIIVNAPSVGLNDYDLGLPSSQPLPVRWNIRQDDGNSFLEGTFGTVTFSWLFDDGVSRHGLTDPAGPDAIPYQGGSLDLTAFVPLWYVGVSAETTPDVPPIQMTLGAEGTTLQLGGLPARAPTEDKLQMVVTAQNTSNAVDVAYAQTVRFSSSDPMAKLPPPYTFVPEDQGVHRFEMSFGSAGFQSVTVMDQETPAIQSSQTDIQVHTLYRVGCSALPFGDLSTWMVLLWASRLWKRRGFTR